VHVDSVFGDWDGETGAIIKGIMKITKISNGSITMRNTVDTLDYFVIVMKIQAIIHSRL